MKVLVTGGAGFIGSHMVDALLKAGHQVVALDNLSTGHRKFLDNAEESVNFSMVVGDLLDNELLETTLAGVDTVIHLAANADVRFGWNHPRRDIEQNVLVTQNLLEAMRSNGATRILFSSTGSVYGNAQVQPTPENAPFPAQTSLYGASKVAAESLIAAYAEAGHLSATIFRFVSILGPRYTHGHVIDFVAQLVQHPDRLRILGDGSQRKSYLHVDDCVAAVTSRLGDSESFEVLNLGHDDYCTVLQSAIWISERMALSPRFDLGISNQGWVGDNPFIHLDNSKMKSFGWVHSNSIRKSVEDTVDWLIENQWALNLAILER